MIVKPAKRLDWFTWHDPDRAWCQAYAELPGLQAGSSGSSLIVDFHVSHFPCVPDSVWAQAQTFQNEVRRQDLATAPLRAYQAADAIWLEALRGALLAYEMRLGKTALACHLHDPASGIILIVAPLAAHEAWRDWIERTFNTGLICLAGRMNVEAQPGYPAYFCHYEILGSHSDFFQQQRIGTLVFDECHMLQGKYTQRLSAACLLAPKAGKLLGLSGTPMWNKPKSLYRLLHLLMPGAWGTAFQFNKRYCDAQPGAHGWTYDGISNADELQARLGQVMVRRTWAEVAPELPPTIRVIEPVGLTGAQFTAIEAAAERASLARGISNEAGYNAILRRKLGEVKIAPAVEIARQAAVDGHKVVLWCWHNEIADKVAEKLDGAFRLRSADPAKLREAHVQQFRDHVGSCFLVANMGVGGVGLDLSCSDYAIFVELDWTPAVVQQAAMRTFHIDRPHCLVFLHADCPMEAALIEALDVKNDFAAAAGLGVDDVMRRILR